jgi:hypothetical protein
LDQLREAIVAAHRAATSHEISAADLPRSCIMRLVLQTVAASRSGLCRRAAGVD